MSVITYRDALNHALREEMARDDRVFLMGEEVGVYQGAYKVSRGLLDEFGPMRVVDTPITELGFAGVGVGAAMGGLRPAIEFMTWNFALLAVDQLVRSACRRYSAGRAARHCNLPPSTPKRSRAGTPTYPDSRSSCRPRRRTRR